MSKILRKVQKIFGINAGFDQIAVFGSLANTSPAYSTDPAVIQSLTQYDDGWFEAVIGDNSPAIEDVNALDYVETYQLAYLMQTGVPEWDATTTYYIGSFASDGLGNLYYSTVDNNINNAFTDGTKWQLYGGLTTNINPANVTVVSGKTYWYPNYSIPIGTTWTVNTGGSLMSAGTVVVNGTLIVNGTSIVL